MMKDKIVVMTSFEYLKNHDNQFLALTGLKYPEFEILMPYFQAAYDELYPPAFNWHGAPRQRKIGGGGKDTLLGMEEKLVFILSHLKTNPLQSAHGAQYKRSQAWANKWIHRLTPVLHRALDKSGVMPSREGDDLMVQESEEETAEYMIDGTARERERPKDSRARDAHYNGKEKAYTDKNIVLVNADDNWITFLGRTEAGSKHDKKMVDEAGIVYPAACVLIKDTGFQGYEPADVYTCQPSKKQRGKPVQPDIKQINRFISGVRVRIEHAIAGIKRYRIVKEVLRVKRDYFSDMVMAIACALHNFRIVVRSLFSWRTLLEI
jgi:hypothetical protein